MGLSPASDMARKKPLRVYLKVGAPSGACASQIHVAPNALLLQNSTADNLSVQCTREEQTEVGRLPGANLQGPSVESSTEAQPEHARLTFFSPLTTLGPALRHKVCQKL